MAAAANAAGAVAQGIVQVAGLRAGSIGVRGAARSRRRFDTSVSGRVSPAA
jgi:hypothetical protein